MISGRLRKHFLKNVYHVMKNMEWGNVKHIFWGKVRLLFRGNNRI